jgi:hypothetical protein
MHKITFRCANCSETKEVGTSQYPNGYFEVRKLADVIGWMVELTKYNEYLPQIFCSNNCKVRYEESNKPKLARIIRLTQRND